MRIKPADIGNIHVGQFARLKFSAYDFAIHGSLQGIVTFISADSITNEEGESYFLVRIKPSRLYMGVSQDEMPIRVGMTAEADILTRQENHPVLSDRADAPGPRSCVAGTLMRLVVFTVSPAFAEFIEAHLHLPLELKAQLEDPAEEPNCLHLLHLTGMEDACFEWLQQNVPARCRLAALCSDRPDIREMLEGVKLGVRAYCNSHMAAIHYRQMLHLLEQRPELVSRRSCSSKLSNLRFVRRISDPNIGDARHR